MSNVSLNKSIFRLIVGTVLFTTLGVLISMWATTATHAQRQLNRNLTVAQGVLQQVLSGREQELYISADVLTSDYGFKQTIATGDEPTIRSVLVNHGQRINADLMALINLEGDLLSSTSESLPIGSQFPYHSFIMDAIEQGGGSNFMLFDGQLYQVILLTVDAPRPIALALIGFQLNSALLEQLKNISQLELTLKVVQQQKQLFSLTTLPADAQPFLLEHKLSELNWFETAVLKQHAYIAHRFELSQLDEQILWVELAENAEQLFSEFNQLQLTISLVAAISMLLALIFGALFSRKLALPLQKLAGIANRISRGNYQQQLQLAKGQLTEVQDLSSAIEVMQDNIRERESKIIYQATHDLLTQVNNRYYIETLLDEKLSHGQTFQAIGINIFGFRGINDIFGYHSGDLCIKVLAARVAALGGITARLTGGELLWLPSQAQSPAQLALLKQQLELPVEDEGVVINIKLAMGIINCPGDATTAQVLFKRMNIVLDEAQLSKQLLLEYAAEIEQRYQRRLSIIVELKKALLSEQHELSLCYQPKLHLPSNKITSVEALIRWNNASLGFVSPDDFITIAEQAGFIDKVTDWVIRRAIRDAGQFLAAGLDICIALNLSAHDVMDAELLPEVMALLDGAGLKGQRLSFEITESDVVKEPQKAIEHLSEFKQQGFSLAIDDFGTGYSSMAYLKNLPVDCIKIDKSFVLNLASQTGDQHIVQTVLALAKSFELQVVAEGVEDHTSLALLAEWGCDYAQGYHISKPVSAEILIDWLTHNAHTNWLENK